MLTDAQNTIKETVFSAQGQNIILPDVRASPTITTSQENKNIESIIQTTCPAQTRRKEGRKEGRKEKKIEEKDPKTNVALKRYFSRGLVSSDNY